MLFKVKIEAKAWLFLAADKHTFALLKCLTDA